MKDILITGLGVLIGVALVGAVVFGLAWLLKADATYDAKERQAQCKQIADLAKAQSWVEKDHNCFLVVDGKLVEVK